MLNRLTRSVKQPLRGGDNDEVLKRLTRMERLIMAPSGAGKRGARDHEHGHGRRGECAGCVDDMEDRPRRVMYRREAERVFTAGGRGGKRSRSSSPGSEFGRDRSGRSVKRDGRDAAQSSVASHTVVSFSLS